MKKFIIEKGPTIFLISLLAGTISQVAVQFAGFNIKGLGLLVSTEVFLFSGFIRFLLDCRDESDKKK